MFYYFLRENIPKRLLRYFGSMPYYLVFRDANGIRIEFILKMGCEVRHFLLQHFGIKSCACSVKKVIVLVWLTSCVKSYIFLCRQGFIKTWNGYGSNVNWISQFWGYWLDRTKCYTIISFEVTELLKEIEDACLKNEQYKISMLCQNYERNI